MVYGIIGMINFAHGDVFMVGAFVAIIVMTALAGVTSVPLGILAALILSAALCGLYGFSIERVAYRPLRGSFRLAPLISAIGMSILLENYVQTSQGALERAIPAVIPGGITLMNQNGFIVQLSWMQMAIVIVTLVTLSIFTYIVTKTPLGRAMRAVEQDAKMAALLGIDTNRTISFTFIIGSALAAVAGVMFLLYYGVIDFYIGFNAGIKAFTAAVLGGIGSLPGAVLGGLLIGLIEAFWSGYATVAYKDVAVYSILAIVLMFMPTGLLGRHDVEKV
jgi:branched-chain amino acid transport system permease protein